MMPLSGSAVEADMSVFDQFSLSTLQCVQGSLGLHGSLNEPGLNSGTTRSKKAVYTCKDGMLLCLLEITVSVQYTIIINKKIPVMKQ